MQEPVSIKAGEANLQGDLSVPESAAGIVIFAHGSGSSRKSPRNRFVAEFLYEASLGTLLMDLLTEEEERLDEATGHLRFDIELLAKRLAAASGWVDDHPQTKGLPLGFFGASTGAAAALVAAVRAPQPVAAIVSRGGRPDLAGDSIGGVGAPTLLIVGGSDHHVMELNRKALTALECEKRLEVVKGASHLFEEPGALETVAELARDWFVARLAPR